MSIHIGAEEKHAVAETVLLPGDPLRAEYIATTFLKEVEKYSAVRNMLGFTGYTDQGKRISVQGSGMGMPSLSIYVNELIDSYGVKKIIRVGSCGSCGSFQSDIKVRDIILAQGSCSDSNINRRRFQGMDFAPIASWSLLQKASQVALMLGIHVRVGNILSSDLFYNNFDENEWKLWAEYGVLAVEMESAELYTLAAFKKIEALSILTVSDVLPTKVFLSSEERQSTFSDMVKIALQL